MLSDAEKTIVFEPNISSFNGRDYVKGYIKNVVSGVKYGADVYLRSLTRAFSSLAFKNYENAKYLTNSEINSVIESEKASGYGVMFVLNNPNNLQYFNTIKKFAISHLKLTEKGGKNCVIIGGVPENDDMVNYDTLIYLDKPLSVEKYVNFKTVIVNNEVNAFNLDGVSTDRLALASVFKGVVNAINSGANKTLLDIYNYVNGVSEVQFAFAISVFLELEFLTYNGSYSVNGSTKKELTTSTVYNEVRKIIN